MLKNAAENAAEVCRGSELEFTGWMKSASRVHERVLEETAWLCIEWWIGLQRQNIILPEFHIASDCADVVFA